MRFLISFSVFYIITDFVSAKDSKEIMKENTLKEASEGTDNDHLLRVQPLQNYLWPHNPTAQLMLPRPDAAFWSRSPILRKPGAFSLTKLAKSVQQDSPYFEKSDFQFERRSKPITLVAFRNPRFAPSQYKALQKMSGQLNSLEVAELQSPYNDVSSFWQDDRLVA